MAASTEYPVQRISPCPPLPVLHARGSPFGRISHAGQCRGQCEPASACGETKKDRRERCVVALLESWPIRYNRTNKGGVVGFLARLPSSAFSVVWPSSWVDFAVKTRDHVQIVPPTHHMVAPYPLKVFQGLYISLCFLRPSLSASLFFSFPPSPPSCFPAAPIDCDPRLIPIRRRTNDVCVCSNTITRQPREPRSHRHAQRRPDSEARQQPCTIAANKAIRGKGTPAAQSPRP